MKDTLDLLRHLLVKSKYTVQGNRYKDVQKSYERCMNYRTCRLQVAVKVAVSSGTADVPPVLLAALFVTPTITKPCLIMFQCRTRVYYKLYQN